MIMLAVQKFIFCIVTINYANIIQKCLNRLVYCCSHGSALVILVQDVVYHYKQYHIVELPQHIIQALRFNGTFTINVLYRYVYSIVRLAINYKKLDTVGSKVL